jgi:hypothetical protein
VAGFDFEFGCDDTERPLAREVVRRVQLLCRNLDLDFRYSRSAGGWWIKIDGSLPAMQALIQPLASELPAFVDGYIAGSQEKSRRRPEKRFLSCYLASVARMREQIEKITADFGGTHYSYIFDVGNATHLAGHASDYTTALISFHNGRLSASQVIEEAHTFAEAVLRSCLPKEDRDKPFAALVWQAAALIHFDDEHKDALLKLKDLRRSSKHQIKRIRRGTAVEVLPDVTGTMQVLLRHLRRQSLRLDNGDDGAQPAVAADGSSPPA